MLYVEPGSKARCAAQRASLAWMHMRKLLGRPMQTAHQQMLPM